MKAAKGAIQRLELMLLRLPKKIKKKIKPKTWATLSAIFANKKTIMLTNIPKKQKTCNGLGDFYVND